VSWDQFPAEPLPLILVLGRNNLSSKGLDVCSTGTLPLESRENRYSSELPGVSSSHCYTWVCAQENYYYDSPVQQRISGR